MKENSLSIEDLLRDTDYGMALSLLAGGSGLAKRITTSRIQKPGLALTGYTEHLHADRIQILGNTEISYLHQLPEDLARNNIDTLCRFPITCFVVTLDLDPPEFFIQSVEKAGIPLLKTPHLTSTFISSITRYLEERLLPITHVHGVLVDVFGVGVLLLGKSGIGKSECALDLVIRGHRLVADDVVQIRKKVTSTLVGAATEPLQFRMEVRGLGVINIRDLFGISAIRGKKVINLVIELVEWDPDQEYDRLGIDEMKHSILDVELQYLKIPIRYGRNLTSIIEVAARNFLLKTMGYNSTQEFHDYLMARLSNRSPGEEVE